MALPWPGNANMHGDAEQSSRNQLWPSLIYRAGGVDGTTPRKIMMCMCERQGGGGNGKWQEAQVKGRRSGKRQQAKATGTWPTAKATGKQAMAKGSDTWQGKGMATGWQWQGKAVIHSRAKAWQWDNNGKAGAWQRQGQGQARQRRQAME
ncbi:hypothetical protein EI94DRAFT_1703311 [Lactarius quietus]|nr:hypothetical protein EI94DRAFT_1703311 [Lactarius quietus]